MTNKELIDKILAMPNNDATKTKLRDMKKEDLEMYLYRLQDEHEQTVQSKPEPQEKTVEEKVGQEQLLKEDNKQPLAPIVAKKTTKGKLEIAKDVPYFAHGATVRITNLGGGIFYYGKEIVHYGKDGFEVAPGNSVEVTGADVIVLLAMSQPRYLIEEI